MRRAVCLAILTAACRPQATTPKSDATVAPPIRSIADLIDSLAAVGGCPRSDLPPITRFDFQPTAFDSRQGCGIVAAAIRKLAMQPALEPVFAPGDTARIVEAKVFWSIRTDLEGTLRDTAARVELDIRGRPKLLWAEYHLAPERETFGAVHR